MRRFGHFLGQVRSWKSGKVARQVGTSAARRFSACFEPLEERQLLAANILASLDGNLLAAGESNQLQLDVAGGPAILGFQMQGTGGTLDPDSVVIKDLSGHTIAPVLADADLNGSTDSLVLAELAPGSYTVTTRGEGSTAGTYHIEACLLGDMDGDGQVDEHELLWTEAATIQSLGGWNHVTQMYYAQFGINLNSNLYAGEIDCDVDGRIDNFDLGLITTNASGAQVTIELIGDITPPDIHADLVNDTGQSDSDGISQEVTIAGTITDDHQIVEFAAGIDGMNRVDYVSLLGDVDAAGHFQLDFAKLEEIAGDSLANNGAHSLFLVAKDEYGNESALYEVPFELDTIAPAAPTGLDLTEASDLGFYNDDDITSDNTPTITIDAETGTMVALHSDIDGMLGESLVNSPVSITATMMSSGVHQLTAVATDAAGNVSAVSASLPIAIDTIAPAVPTLDLATADDTGTVGDQLTEKTSVTLEGVAEVDSRVTLSGYSTTTADATTGAFSFAGLPLVFGPNAFIVTSMDLAGNTSNLTQTIHQNDPPAIGTGVGPITVVEDPGVQSYGLAALFNDPNLASGDTLTLSVLANTNPTLVTPSLSGAQGQIVNSQLQLAFGANQHGSATLTIRATDSYGRTVDAQIVVNVTPDNDAPALVNSATWNCDENSYVQKDLWNYFDDVETADANLLFEIVPGSATLGTVELLTDGHTVRFTADQDVNGTGSFEVKVTDTGDGSSPAKTVHQTFEVVIAAINDPPHADPTTLTTDEDVAVDVDLWTLVDDTETPDDELIFSVGGAQGGSVTLLNGHIAHFVPGENFNGAASFTYSVTDTGDGDQPAETAGPVTINVTVTPVNDAPVAQTDSISTDEDSAVTIDLWDLVDDVETSDANLTFTVGDADHGMVALQADGHHVVFVPTENYSGAASFSYTVTDKDDGSSPAVTVGPTTVSVTVNPVNDAPQAATGSTSTDEDTPVTIDLWTLVSDIETDDADLTFVVSNPSGGTAVLQADNHTVLFTPAQDFNGAAGFEYTVTDKADGSSPAITVGPKAVSVTVNPVNDAPVAQTDSISTDEDTPKTIDLWTLVSDVETDDADLTFVISNPSGGTAVLQADNHTVLFTPTTNYHGAAGFEYSVTDQDEGSSPAITVGPIAVSITVNPVNDAPTVQDGSTDTNEDTMVEIDLWPLAGDLETPDANLTFTITDTQNGSVGPLVDGHIVQFTPAQDFNDNRGTAQFTYTVTDAGDGTAAPKTSVPATVTVHVAPINDAPTAVDDSPSVPNSQSSEIDVLLNDVDPDLIEGDTLTIISVTQGSQAGQVVISNGGTTITYTPVDLLGMEGSETFDYTIEDANGEQSTATVTVTMTTNHAPDAVDDDDFTTNEDTPLGFSTLRNLLANDTDEDPGDTLSVVPFVSTTDKGAFIDVREDGTFTYDPGAVFQYLAEDEWTTDTFDYTINDGHGGEDTATVTITITGRNDVPTAYADPDESTDEATAISIDVVANDTDPDTNDTLVVGSHDEYSDKGAKITLNPDGTLKYDPTTSDTLTDLREGQQTDDSFEYMVSDGHGGSSPAMVSLVITGLSTAAPQVDNPIDDLTLTDSSDPLMTEIDLSTVFSDSDGDDLTFTATSSNTDLITVAVDGDKLQVTYKTYTTAQDRTPSIVTVRATEDTVGALWIEDTFTVTVEPEETAGVYLVVRETATPEGETTATELPSSIGEVPVGETYVVEIWMQDTYDSSVTGGPSAGLVGGEFDLYFDPALVADLIDTGAETDLHYEGAFFSSGQFDSGTVDNAAGLIDDFGAGKLGDGIGLTPDFVRLGYVTFTASSAGTQNFSLDNIDAEVARWGDNFVDLSQIGLGSASVKHVSGESLPFAIAYSSMSVTGTINGATLVPTPTPAGNAYDLTGTINVIVDDLDNPTSIQIDSGNLDVIANTSELPYRPGVGGTDSAAYGDFAFQAQLPTTEIIEMAIRELEFGFSSDVIALTGGVQFGGEEIQWLVTSGFDDILWPTGGDRYDMANLWAEPVGGEQGRLEEPIPGSGIYTLTIHYTRTIDLSDLIGPNSQITLSSTLYAEYNSSGAALMGTETSDDTGTGVYATLSQDPTGVAAGETVSSLPQSEVWIDEWDSYWVELWVRTDQADGVAAAVVDLQYDTDYFTATQIDHSGTFVEDPTGEIDQDGFVLGLGGNTTLAGIGVDGYALIGRVKFESIGDDGVDIDPDDLSIGPLDLGIQLDNVAVELVGQGAVEATARRTPNTELWAVPYDVNDNGKIGLGDLSYFVAAYGENSINANTPFTATLDFNHNGKVALGDLSYLASNYGLTRGGGVDVTFPESFTQRWVGAELDVEGTSTVGEVLDAAVQAWQESLGLVNPIEIQLVVKDFGTAQLGEAVILEVDENGLPTKGRVTIDDNGGGIGWSSQLDAEAAADLYDLYTVLLHEIGHTLGFAAAYDGFAEHLDVVDGSTVFVTDGLSVAMDDAGNHIADDSLGDDLMSTTLSPGVRKTVSNLDVRMLYAAYQTAIGGIDGYSDAGAALFASIELTGELLATTMSTAELSRLEGPLEGDVTWDRLLPGFVGNDISDEGECVASVDAFDWLLMALPEVTQDAPLATTYRFAGHDTNEGHSADEIFAELATLQASHQTEQDVSDVLLAAWDQWSNI